MAEVSDAGFPEAAVAGITLGVLVEVCDIVQGEVAGVEWVEGKWGRL